MQDCVRHFMPKRTSHFAVSELLGADANQASTQAAFGRITMARRGGTMNLFRPFRRRASVGLKFWWDAGASANADDLREHILAGHKSGKPFTAYVPTIPLPPDLGTVLDFGCGVGRNFPFLKRVATRVEGYDLAPMIKRCRELAPLPADDLSDDWQQVRTRRYDLVFASLVLQHIEPAALREYLEDFARMAPAVYLHTRSENDFGPEVLDLIARTGLFHAGECAVVDHDPATHQLRVLGKKTFDAARATSESLHYELLLRSTKGTS